MVFALSTDTMLVSWDGEKLGGIPDEAVERAREELAGRDAVAATPTGPWYQPASPEGVLIVLRELWPEAEVLGDPPVIPTQPDELAVPGNLGLAESRFEPRLHPRDRLGRWRESFAHELEKGPSGREENWMGWRNLRVGDRVVSVHPTTGDPLMHGTVVRIPGDLRTRSGRRAVHHGGMTVQWDNGVAGKVVGPAQLLRPEGPLGEKDDPGQLSLAEALDGFEHNGLRATVDEAVDRGSTGTVTGLVYEASTGRTAGAFQWELEADQETGERAAYLDSIQLDREFQDRGFGTAFYVHARDALARDGYSKLTLRTAWVGGYQWARAGFDFDIDRYSILGAGAAGDYHLFGDETFARGYAVRDLYVHRVLGGDFEGEQRRGQVPSEHWLDFVSRFPSDSQLAEYAAGREDAFEGTFGTPQEIAAFGRGVHEWTEARDSESLGQRMWLGKRFLIGAAWRGELSLMAQAEESKGGSTKLERVVREVADEWTRDGRLTVTPDTLQDDTAFWDEVERRLAER